ncbi:MAG: hypothetical protein HZA17_04035 [Nitrospirae bacterium]|nr:hypothetical protein [Nitrospirota bacterium]
MPTFIVKGAFEVPVTERPRGLYITKDDIDKFWDDNPSLSLSKDKGPVNKKAINEAESYLILAGLEANQHLLNDRKTKVESWNIKGVLRNGRGKPSEAAESLKRCLNL